MSSPPACGMDNISRPLRGAAAYYTLTPAAVVANNARKHMQIGPPARLGGASNAIETQEVPVD
eukprot:14869395-Alexandrium_andersonii.AAC.1